LDIAFGRYFSRVICGFFLPRHSGFASLRQSGLCAPRLPVRPTSAALAAQTTFAASCRSTLRVVAPSPSHSPAALRCLDRPLQLLLPEQHRQPLAARLSGLLVPPYLDARALHGSLPFLQLGSCMTDLCSRVLPREPLLLCSLGCRLEHHRALTIGLTG
ncbi:hypothetical protein FOFC_15761, partial [Fusarium oxysporum]